MTDGNRPSWADFGPAEFDSSLLTAAARKRASADADRARSGEVGLFHANRTPDRPPRQAVTAELDGQAPLFGDSE